MIRFIDINLDSLFRVYLNILAIIFIMHPILLYDSGNNAATYDVIMHIIIYFLYYPPKIEQFSYK